MKRVLKWLGIGVAALLTCGAVAVTIGPPKVPAETIARSVDRDPSHLSRAFALPVAAAYGREPYAQSHGSLCGPASVVNVLRSLGHAVTDEDAVLDGSGKCWWGGCMMGLTLDELADIARLQTALRVTVLRDLSPEQFREHLRHSNDPGRRYTINFHREPIFGAGGGHHSPVGGYLEDDDLVLVLDVNADFGPWLVERERLFAAMDTLDSGSERKRGLLLFEPQ